MLDGIIGYIIDKVFSGPFCCIVIFAPGLIVPLYKWLRSKLQRKKEEVGLVTIDELP
jgi:hypothetical protein